ncbi:MAG: dienelactone hydrolase family protein [Pseudomonadota bacterium]
MCDEAKLAEWAKDVRRARLGRREFGVLAGGAALAACAPGSGGEGTEDAADTLGTSENAVSFATEAGTMDAFFVHPVEGSHPAIIIWPDIASIRESKRNIARRLAGQGYAVLVLNPYYRDVAGEQFADFADFIEAGGFQVVRPYREKHTADGIGSDATAAVQFLDAQDAVDTSRGIGVHGYCMGGPLSVWSAAAVPDRIKAAASFHGGGLTREDDPLSPHRTLDRSDAAFLIAVSQDDDAKDPESKTIFAAAAEEAGRPAIVEVYAGDHGWTVPDSPVYAEAEAEKAFADLLSFYGDNL